MKTYEIVIILDSRRIEDNGDTFAKNVTAEIEKLGGKVLDLVNMGRRAFARNIGKSKAGNYLDLIVELDPAKADAYLDHYRLNETVLRQMMFVHDEAAAKYRAQLKAGKVPSLIAAL